MSDLVVHVTCPRCTARLTVHVVGGWDLADVRHTCPTAVTDESEQERRDRLRASFTVAYVPPRLAF
jgi:hypothetical protein